MRNLSENVFTKYYKNCETTRYAKFRKVEFYKKKTYEIQWRDNSVSF